MTSVTAVSYSSSTDRWLSRTILAFLVVGAIALAGFATAWAPAADAAPLNVRGDSDAVHATVTSVFSNVPNSGHATENINSLRDRNSATKWYSATTPSVAAPVFAIYTLSSPAQVTAYSITSANDFATRDPRNWTILGSNNAAAATDGSHASWVELDSKANQAFAARFQRNVYSLATTGNYQYYQLRISANVSGSAVQIADWTLRSGPAGFDTNVLTPSTSWSYLEDGNVDPAPGANRAAWTQVGASLPGTWKTGVSPFGAHNLGNPNLGANYPISTQLKMFLNGTANPVVPAYFFRTTFELDQAGLNSIKGLYGTLVHDDAAVMYINGTQVLSYDEGSAITSNLQYAGGTLTDPRTENFTVPANALVVGQNVVSIELHNVNATSSDIYLALPLLAATSDNVPIPPAPFTPAELSATYPSDTMPVGDNGGDFFVDMLDGFNNLITQHNNVIAPNTLLTSGVAPTAANDTSAVAINNGAVGNPAKISQAILDADGNAYATMSDGLGSVLGPIYLQAVNSGMLPKTRALLSSMVEKGRNHEPAKAAYAYKRPYNRLGFVSGSQCGSPAFTGTGRIERNYSGSYTGLCSNGSFPSGHTNHGFAQGTIWATLIPELAPQILYRTSEYGNNRIVLGFHYPLDVMSGRMAGQATAQQRWSDPAFRALLVQAVDELHNVLGEACVAQGHSSDLEECAEAGTGLLSDEQALQIYTERLAYSTYTLTNGNRVPGFPVAYPAFANTPLDVPAGAADLLRTAFPQLTNAQRSLVFKATALPGGYALDKTKDGKPSWQRINIAAAIAATVTVDGSGNLIVNGQNMGDGGGAPSADANLLDLRVNGTTVSGFAAGTTGYNVTLPAGTTQVPTVSASPAFAQANVTVTQAVALPGTASVLVTAEDGTTTKTYTVSFTVSPTLSNDANLLDLRVNGTTVGGFAAATTGYNVALPPGTVQVPTVTATAAQGAATVAVTQASALPGTASVLVTAENGTTTRTYTVAFTVEVPPVDSQAPVTVAAANPQHPNGALGWYLTAPTVTLSATDNTSAPGQINTFWRFGTSGAFNAYTAPIQVMFDLDEDLQYYSVDANNNTETVKSISLKVDRTAPTVSHSLNTAPSFTPNSPAVLALSATDPMSGVEAILVKIGSAAWTTYNDSNRPTFAVPGNYTVQYKAIDLAGNESAADTVAIEVVEPAILEPPTLTLKSNKTINVKAKAKTVTIKAQVSNPDGVSPVKVCVKAPKAQLKGAKCVTVKGFNSNGRKSVTFKLKPVAKKAAGKKIKVKLTIQSPGNSQKTTSLNVKVAK